jgi:hypothetical protein
MVKEIRSTEGKWKLGSEEPNNRLFSPDIRETGGVCSTKGDVRNAYKILNGKLKWPKD